MDLRRMRKFGQRVADQSQSQNSSQIPKSTKMQFADTIMDSPKIQSLTPIPNTPQLCLLWTHTQIVLIINRNAFSLLLALFCVESTILDVL